MGDVGMGPRPRRHSEDGTRYRCSASLDGPLTVRARVESARGRRVEVPAHIEDAQAAILTESTALFMRVTPEEERRMSEAMERSASPS